MPVERAFSSDQDTLANLKRLYDEASVLARIGAWGCDLATERLTWTNGVFDLFELPRGVAPQRQSIVEMYVGSSCAEMQALRAEAIRSCGSFSLDAQIRTSRGASRWMRLSADVDCKDGRPVRIFGAKQDITHERALWAQLRQLADCDPLTGLANRRTFEARCRELTRAAAAGGPRKVAALAIIDLDRFKPVNDRFGHNAGDACLSEIATRLARAFDSQTLVARLGGDEFGVLFRAAPSEADVLRRLEQALADISRPFLWGGHRIEVGASVGVTMVAKSHHRDVSDLLAEADDALYEAKASGRNAIRIFRERAYSETVSQAIAANTISIAKIRGQCSV